jgi:hypothetical protein
MSRTNLKRWFKTFNRFAPFNRRAAPFKNILNDLNGNEATSGQTNAESWRLAPFRGGTKNELVRNFYCLIAAARRCR